MGYMDANRTGYRPNLGQRPKLVLPKVSAIKAAVSNERVLLSLCKELAPEGRKESHEYRFNGLDGNDGLSTTIALSGPWVGTIKHWKTGNKYDIIDLAEARLRVSQADAIAFVRRRSNMTVEELAACVPVRKTEAELKIDAEKRADKVRKAWRIFEECDDIVGTLAEEYLRKRGIKRSLPVTLRFHKALPYWDSDKDGKPALIGKFPALVCKVQRADDSFCGVHRIYLDPGGDGKAKLTTEDGRSRPVKKLLGDTDGGAIRCCDDTDVVSELGIAEGVEDALSIPEVYDGKPGWAAISAVGIRKLVLPAWVTHPVFYPDNDVAKKDRKGRFLLNEFGQPARAGLDACTAAVARLRSDTCFPDMHPVRGDRPVKDVNALLMLERFGVVS